MVRSKAQARDYMRDYRARQRSEQAAAQSTRPVSVIVTDRPWPDLLAAVDEEIAGLPAHIVSARSASVASARRIAAQLDADHTSPHTARMLTGLGVILRELHDAAAAEQPVQGKLAQLRAQHAAR